MSPQGKTPSPSLLTVCQGTDHSVLRLRSRYEQFLQPLLDSAPAGSQGLFFNFPGQAHTEFGGESTTLNNAVLARAFDALVSTLQAQGAFAAAVDGGAERTAIAPIGVGNGANIATYWMKELLSAEEAAALVSSAILINPYTEADAHLSLVMQNWLNTCALCYLCAPACQPMHTDYRLRAHFAVAIFRSFSSSTCSCISSRTCCLARSTCSRRLRPRPLRPTLPTRTTSHWQAARPSAAGRRPMKPWM